MIVKVCLLIVLATVVMSAPPTKAPKKELTIQDHWANFKTEHKRNYENEQEEQKRFGIFEKNFNSIREHNIKYEAGEISFKQGINAFADLTHEEFAKTHLMRIPLPPNDDHPKKGALAGSH